MPAEKKQGTPTTNPLRLLARFAQPTSRCALRLLCLWQVPGALIQASVLVRYGLTPSLVVSVALSILTTAFTVACMNVDMDTNVVYRRGSPECYGYLRDSNAARTASLLCMFGMTAGQFAIKCAAIALLSVAKPDVLHVYLGTSVLLARQGGHAQPSWYDSYRRPVRLVHGTLVADYTKGPC